MWNPAKYPSHELQFERYRDFRDYLLRFPWEWMITLTFPPDVTFYPAHRLFKEWRIDLVDDEKIQLGGFVISATRSGLMHLHVLAFGRNRAGKTLLDCCPRKWEDRWPYHARIKDVDDLLGACDYVARHFLGFRADHAQIDSFNSMPEVRRGSIEERKKEMN